MEMKLADGKLTAEEGSKSLTFVKSNTNKGSSTTGTTTPAAGNANGSSTSRSGSENSTTKVDLTPVTIADDEVCKIVVTSKGEDFTGDPGYSLTITNKSDKSIFVTDATDSFSVNGKMATAYLNVSIKGGMYADSFMYFTRDELGGGPRPLCLLCRRVGAGVRHDEAVDEAGVALREDGPHEVGYDGLLVVGGDHEGIAMVLLGLGQLDVTVHDDADDVGKLIEIREGEEEPQDSVEDDDRRQAGLEHVHEQHPPLSASRPDTLKKPGADVPARLGASHRSFA